MVVRFVLMLWMVVRMILPCQMFMGLVITGMPMHETVGVRMLMFMGVLAGCIVVSMGMDMRVLMNMPVFVFILQQGDGGRAPLPVYERQSIEITESFI